MIMLHVITRMPVVSTLSNHGIIEYTCTCTCTYLTHFDVREEALILKNVALTWLAIHLPEGKETEREGERGGRGGEGRERREGRDERRKQWLHNYEAWL